MHLNIGHPVVVTSRLTGWLVKIPRVDVDGSTFSWNESYIVSGDYVAAVQRNVSYFIDWLNDSLLVSMGVKLETLPVVQTDNYNYTVTVKAVTI